MTSLGQVAAGDEKLMHFTGDSLITRYVPSKSDREGFWMYELCVRLPNLKSYHVGLRLAVGSTRRGVAEPVVQIIADWVDCLQSFPDRNCILCFDSYYFSQDVRDLLVARNVKYIAGCRSNAMTTLSTVIEGYLHSIGDYKIAWNAARNEIFCGNTSKKQV